MEVRPRRYYPEASRTFVAGTSAVLHGRSPVWSPYTLRASSAPILLCGRTDALHGKRRAYSLGAEDHSLGGLHTVEASCKNDRWVHSWDSEHEADYMSCFGGVVLQSVERSAVTCWLVHVLQNHFSSKNWQVHFCSRRRKGETSLLLDYESSLWRAAFVMKALRGGDTRTRNFRVLA